MLAEHKNASATGLTISFNNESSSSNYAHLQNLIKRDAEGYRVEFLEQYHHFQNALILQKENPEEQNEHFEDLLTFLSHTSSFFPQSKKEFPSLIMEWVNSECIIGTSLLARWSPSLRKAVVRALLLLRKHNSLTRLEIIELFFRLFGVQDKQIRELLFESIVGEVCRANRPTINNHLNRSLQGLMYKLLSKDVVSSCSADSTESLALQKTLQVVIELYRRGVWKDAKTVNVIAEIVTLKKRNDTTSCTKVFATALNFFINRFQGRSLLENVNGNGSDDSDDDDEESTHLNLKARTKYEKMKFKSSLSGKKRSVQKKLKKTLNQLGKKGKKGKQGGASATMTFPSISLLNNPQDFCERLFATLRSSNDTFQLKLLMMNVLSRVIGSHRLIVMEYYSFLLRYIQPHQEEVTQILAYTAQACHPSVPVDLLETLLDSITKNFVAEHCRNEVIAAGLNGIREICARCPGAMSQELMQDLSRFKGYQDKGVVVATRSLISLYREVNPSILDKKDRGKDLSMQIKRVGGDVNALGTKRAKMDEDVEHLDANLSSDNDEDNCFDDNEEDDENNDNDEDLDDSDCGSIVSGSDESQSDSDSDSQEPKEQREDIIKKSSMGILSSEDMNRLRKRYRGEDEDESSDSDNEAGEESHIIDPASLQSTKKTKADYEARYESIREGREGRLKFGSRKGKHNLTKSTSNRIKEKRTKNAVMLAHKQSVRAKSRRSLHDKQKLNLKHVQNQKKRY